MIRKQTNRKADLLDRPTDRQTKQTCRQTDRQTAIHRPGLQVAPDARNVWIKVRQSQGHDKTDEEIDREKGSQRGKRNKRKRDKKKSTDHKKASHPE